MAKIESRLNVSTAKAGPAGPAPVKPAPAAPAPADRLVVSDRAKTAERLRTFNRDAEALLEFRPRTTAQATGWLDKARRMHDEGTPVLKNGDLKVLPLKERQQFTILVGRLANLLEDGPALLRFFKGE